MPPARRRQIAALEAFVKPRLERGQRIDTLETGRPEVRASIERARRFLGADGAARRGARRRRDRARHAPLRRAPPRRLRGDALPRRDAGAAARASTAASSLLLGPARLRGRAVLGYVAQTAIGAALAELIARRAAAADAVLPAAAGLPRRPGAAARLRAAAAPAAEERAGAARDAPRVRRAEGRRARCLRGAACARSPACSSGRRATRSSASTVVGGFAGAVLVFFAGRLGRAQPAHAVRAWSPLRPARCATASPTCGATRAATRCRSRASRSG